MCLFVIREIALGVPFGNLIFAICTNLYDRVSMHYNNLNNISEYLIVNERDAMFGAYVTAVGFQNILPHTVYPPKEHPDGYYFNEKKGRVLHEYQLVYITKGKGTFASESTPFTAVEKGHILMLYPGQWHTYSPLPETGWNEYYIGFEGEMIEHMLKGRFFEKEKQILYPGMSEELVALFSEAIEAARQDKHATQQLLAGILMHIIGTSLSLERNRFYEQGNAGQKMETAKIIMRENLMKEIDHEELAGKLGVSYSYFRKVFKEYTGYAPAKYFQQLKIRKAKELLASTDATIKEIAYELSYVSVEHFFSVFKKNVGVTPMEFRNTVRMKGDILDLTKNK